jgi:hypothetical protein
MDSPMTHSPPPRPFNTWDAMKLLGLGLMIIDHVCYFFYPDQLAWRSTTRGGAPIFLFLTGFARSSPIKLDLVAAVLIMGAINIMAGGGPLPLNILGTILIGRFLVRAMDSGRLKLNKPYEWMALMVVLMPSVLLFQTGTIGLLFVLAGYMQNHAERFPQALRRNFMILTFFLHGGLQAWSMEVDTLSLLITALGMFVCGYLCWKLTVKPITLPKAVTWSEPLLRFSARHMLWIYVIHYGGLQLLMHKSY